MWGEKQAPYWPRNLAGWWQAGEPAEGTEVCSLVVCLLLGSAKHLSEGGIG